MPSRFAIHLVSVSVLFVASVTGCEQRRVVQVPRWDISGKIGADSLVHALATRIGAAPDTLQSCSPHRIRVVYVNAPIDFQPRITFDRGGSESIASSHVYADYVERYAHPHVAATIAAIAWFSGAREDAIDTVSVALVRTKSDGWRGQTAGIGGEDQFVRPPNGGAELVHAGQAMLVCKTYG